MKEKYLVINAGSSSLKFTLFLMPEEEVIATGNFEKIGFEDSFYTVKTNGKKIKKEMYFESHKEAVEQLVKELIEYKLVENLDEIKGIGHRILHGGEKYKKSVLIDGKVLDNIKNLTKFGPLHHPGQIAGIEELKKYLKNVPNVAVFDTSFHQTIPEENYMYGVPYEWYEKYKVRKYGFHGTSHKYITNEMKKKLQIEDPNLIICHIGSGASIACIKEGKCFDTSMGLTPLDGQIMCTRSGSIDPAIVEYIMDEEGKTAKEVIYDLNMDSGLLGLTGKNDLRDVEVLVNNGDKKAIMAFEMYINSIVKYIAQYYFELNGNVDALVFTAGCGENSANLRHKIIDKVKDIMNINYDEELNNNVAGFKSIQTAKLSDDDSYVQVWVIPTDEEKMILEDTQNIIGKKGTIRKK